MCDFFNYRVVFLFSSPLPPLISSHGKPPKRTHRMDQEYLIVCARGERDEWEKKKKSRFYDWLLARALDSREIIKKSSARIGWMWPVVEFLLLCVRSSERVIKEAVNCRVSTIIITLRFTCCCRRRLLAANILHRVRALLTKEHIFRAQRQNDWLTETTTSERVIGNLRKNNTQLSGSIGERKSTSAAASPRSMGTPATRTRKDFRKSLKVLASRLHFALLSIRVYTRVRVQAIRSSTSANGFFTLFNGDGCRSREREREKSEMGKFKWHLSHNLFFLQWMNASERRPADSYKFLLHNCNFRP